MIRPLRLVFAIALFAVSCGDNNVLVGPSDIEVSSGDVTLQIHDTLAVQARYRIEQDTIAADDVTWKSSAPDVAEISGTRDSITVLAVSAGTSTITVTGESLISKFVVTVAPARVVGIAIAGAVPTVRVNSTVVINCVAMMSDDSKQNITNQAVWSTDLPNTATVNQAGGITGHAPGDAFVSARFLGFESSTRVVVIP